MNYFIVSDIGGTNSRFKFYDIKNKIVLKEKNYITNNFDSMKSIFLDFCKDILIKKKLINVYIAICGSPSNNKIDIFANIIWTNVDGNKLKKYFDFSKFILINDFEAIGYSLKLIKLKQIITIYKPKIINSENHNKLIIGPGTGLGVCLIYIDINNNQHIIPTESGHLMFHPKNEYEIEFVNFYLTKLNKKTNIKYKYITLENIISGTGVPYIYYFICNKKSQEPIYTNCKDIFENHNNYICKETIKLYIIFLSYALYQYIVSYMPMNGIYFVNDIIKNLIHEIYNNDIINFKKDLFNEIYKLENDIFINLINKIPIYYIDNLDLGNLGALRYGIKNN